MMDDNNNNCREEIGRAYDALRVHVLPGLGDAWDIAGPAVVLVATAILADVWLKGRFPTSDLVEMIHATERRVLGLASVK